MATLSPIQSWPGPGRLLQLAGTQTGATPVLISHGTFSDAGTCIPLAEFLGRERPVFVIEWRGRDTGPGRIYSFDYTDIATGEIAGAIRHCAAQAGEPIHYVGHSGGGLALFLALALDPGLAKNLRSITTMAAQATHTHTVPLRFRLMVRMMRIIGRWRGYWPVRLMGIGPCNEATSLKENWISWTRNQMVHDRNGADILPRLANISTPTLVMGGAGDTTIAPENGCRIFSDAMCETASFHLCSKANGDGEDFNHGRLVRSRAAARSVWPRIARWMAEH